MRFAPQLFSVPIEDNDDPEITCLACADPNCDAAIKTVGTNRCGQKAVRWHGLHRRCLPSISRDLQPWTTARLACAALRQLAQKDHSFIQKAIANAELRLSEVDASGARTALLVAQTAADDVGVLYKNSKYIAADKDRTPLGLAIGRALCAVRALLDTQNMLTSVAQEELAENVCGRVNCGHLRRSHLDQPYVKGGELVSDRGWCTLPVGHCIFSSCKCSSFVEPN